MSKACFNSFPFTVLSFAHKYYYMMANNNYYFPQSRLFTGHTVRLLGQKKISGKKAGGAPLDLPKIRKNPLIEIIAINTG